MRLRAVVVVAAVTAAGVGDPMPPPPPGWTGTRGGPEVAAHAGEDPSVEALIKVNESAAIGALRNIGLAQDLFRAAGAVDVDGDGAGECGYLAELSGAVRLRGRRTPLDPPLLSRHFRKVENGQVERSGYYFCVFLPDAAAHAVPEEPAGGAPGEGNRIDPANAAVLWCAYAWPKAHGISGRRAFFTHKVGEVLACGNAQGRYAGPAGRPAALSAFVPGARDLRAKAAVGAKAEDGELWEVVP